VNAQRLSRIALGIAIVTALGVTGLVTRNILWPEDPDASLQRTGGKVLGDMTGYVGQVDLAAHTVDVSSSPLGIRPVVMVVTSDTAIVVNGKQGGFGDLWKDLPVRVFYEVRDNARYATSIQVTSGDAVASSPTGTAAVPASESKPVVEPAGSIDTKETKTPPAQAGAQPSPPVQPAPASPPPSPAPAVQPPPPIPTGARAAAPGPPAAVVSPPRFSAAPSAVTPPPPPARTAEPARAKTPVIDTTAARASEPAPPRASEPAPPRASEPAPSRVTDAVPSRGESTPTRGESIPSRGEATPSRATEPAPSRASESASISSPRTVTPAPSDSDGDGSAAIDWLLKGSGRR
jgi:hypothetical protein